MFFNRKRLSLLLVFAVLFSFVSPLGVHLASAYTYNDPTLTTEAACAEKGGDFSTAYNGSSLESKCLIKGSASDEATIILNAGWLASCMAQEVNDGRQFSVNDLQDNSLVLGGREDMGYLVDQEDGIRECTKSSNVASALSALGYTSMVAMLHDIGCKDEKNSQDRAVVSCSDMSDNDLYTKLVRYKYNVQLTDYDKYFIALRTFQIGCKAGEVSNPTDADLYSLNQDPSHTNLYRIQVVDDKGTALREAIYKTGSGKDRGDTAKALNSSVGWDDGTFKCETLASMINDYSNAYLRFIKDNPATYKSDVSSTSTATPDDSKSTTSCAIEGVGWIVCPVLNFLSSITDAIYKLISSWLTIDVKLFDVDTATYRGWNAMRNLANVGFVIVFLFVIFSQLTGAGISNYGIKKVLPRLIVMAIAINASFYITQLMIDLSNIAGSSVTTFFNSAAVFDNNADGFLSKGNSFSEVGVSLLSGGAVAGIAAAASVGAIAYGGVGLFIMVILAAVVAVAMTLLVLAARQALAVIIVVTAPLALLAKIFPNTSKFYDIWKKVSGAVLFIYPAVGFVFGASQAASNILVQQNAILGLAVATIPLLVVIPMLKSSLNVVPFVGGLASKIAGKTSLAGKVGGGIKQARSNIGDDIRVRGLKRGGIGGYLAGGQTRAAVRNRRYSAGAAKAQAAYGAQYTLNSGKASPAEQAAAEAALNKIDEEEISAAEILQNKNSTFEDIKDTAVTGMYKGRPASEAQRTAAVRHIMNNGSFTDRQKLATISAGLSDKQRQAVAQGTLAKGDHKIYGATIGDAILNKQVNEDTLEEFTAKTINEGKVDANTIGRDGKTAAYLAGVAGDTSGRSLVSSTGRANISQAAQDASANVDLARGMNAEHKGHVDTIGRL